MPPVASHAKVVFMTNTLAARAAHLLRSGQDRAAIEAYAALLAQTPADAESWFNLAYLQRRTGAYEAALQSYQRAIDAGVRSPEEALVNRAAILSDHLDDTASALRELDRALAIRPDFFHAVFNAANLREDLGEMDAAAKLYAQALRLAPGNAMVIARLAMLDIHRGNAANASATLAAWLGQRTWPAEDEAELQYAFARASDASDRVDDAFRALSRANELSRKVLRSQGRAYNRQAQAALTDRLIETFPLAFSITSTPGRAPLFICGLFRSGSTLVEQIVAAHSEITSGGELEFIPRMIMENARPYPEALRNFTQSDLLVLRHRYLARVKSVFPDAGFLTDKRPDNFLHIGLIKSIFPDAKIIHTFRNIDDNLFSLYFMNFQNSLSYSFDLADIEHWMLQYRRLMSRWKSLYGSDIFDLDYDVLVKRPRETVNSLLSFCGLSFEEACLSPHMTNNIVRTASALQVREPLHARASGRAMRYASLLRDALAAAE